MTQKQITRYHVITGSLEGKHTVPEAAAALGISERQVTRLRNGVRAEGAAFLIHKNTNRCPKHAVAEETMEKIVGLYRDGRYQGANFLHFSELLAQSEGISLSYSTVRRALTDAGVESPKKRRRFKPHHRRKRKAQEGLLIQMDATPYDWFGDGASYALHGGIDDATGKIVGLYMTQNECLHGYFEVVRQIVEGNGAPIGIYADRHTIFRSPVADKLSVAEQLEGKQAADTQFGRAMKELGVTLIVARSPQAKGRVERLWGTLQSRLPVDFRAHGITTVHEANVFLADYIPLFNERFGVTPELVEKAYIPTALDLDLILCVKETRVLDNGGVFAFHGRQWQIQSEGVPGKTRVEVVANARKGIVALHKGQTLDVLPYLKPQKAKRAASERVQHIPPDDHYYKRGKPATPLYSSDLFDEEIHRMLEDIFLSKYA